ncbi:SRP19 protein [Cardiosporidium cionae]|uniref:SRP19 protein n=1 Tax=Cardiosporidium cionae TaxID=476202 RepID=A0ABQ7JG85_9APIC|nr:SRP19 protein [Cardiosporidium cionae]|eukprot:KAF8822670.1 SRP19 protein [Cardiosporidium cionae]
MDDIKVEDDIRQHPSSSTMAETRRWQIIYPNYIDASKTIPQGRRICKEIAVRNPYLADMKSICDHFHLPTVIEPEKAYPRDWLTKGRLQKVLLRKFGELIPTLKTRVAGELACAAASAKAAKGKKKKKGK